MPEAPTDLLIEKLAGDLKPVTRLPSPWRRTALWFCAVLWLFGLFALFTDFGTLSHRLMQTPDMGLSFIAALLTGVLAALAAFLTSVPGRSAAWALLPLPPLAAWLAAGTAGCLRTEAAAWTHPESPMHPMLCIYVIVLISAPLSALLMWQIMRACPLRPALTASLAGLASAGAAAVILTMVHPFDATYTDLLAHLAAVLLVVGGVRVIGTRMLYKIRRKNLLS
ncbi:MAG TPA: NrsF family protein [Acetobacteraceae bacterium]|nr:NrsF family protein [Acetobacteraceae bacterium]